MLIEVLFFLLTKGFCHLCARGTRQYTGKSRSWAWGDCLGAILPDEHSGKVVKSEEPGLLNPKPV